MHVHVHPLPVRFSGVAPCALLENKAETLLMLVNQGDLLLKVYGNFPCAAQEVDEVTPPAYEQLNMLLLQFIQNLFIFVYRFFFLFESWFGGFG